MTLRLVPVLALAVACGGANKPIENEQMAATSQQAASSSGAIANADASADESTMQGLVTTLGGSFQSLAGQHQAYAAASITGAPDVDAAAAAQDGTTAYSWDGSRLQFSFDASDDQYTYAYDVDLTFADVDGGKSVDGSYSLDWAVSDSDGVSIDYNVDVTYDAVVISAEGCGVSGELTLVYDYSVGGVLGGLTGGLGDASGTVRVVYGGCDNVQLFSN